MKEITYETIKNANETIRTTDIKGKEYAEVNQRVKAFRMAYPSGLINTDMLSNENGICIFTAEVGYWDDEDGYHALASGTAYEKENSTFINKTSYIENCETSAVGRALGFAGFGIDVSIASAEEVGNAIANQNKQENKQEKKATATQVAKLKELYTGELMDKLLEKNGLSVIDDISMTKASDLIKKMTAKLAKENEVE